MRIAFASGKGGVGKTTLAVNTAFNLAKSGKPCIYVDCDVEEPNGHLYLSPAIEQERDVTVLVPRSIKGKCDGCGECQKACRFKSILSLDDSVMVFDELCHSCGACLIACPKDALEEISRPIGLLRRGHSDGLSFMDAMLNIGEARATPLITELWKEEKNTEPEETVIIADAPPGATCPTMEAIKHSDFLLLVTEPTPFGLHDLKVVHGLAKKLSIDTGVVINRSDLGDDRIQDYCSKEGLDILAEIPYDPELAAAGAQGRVIVTENTETGRNMSKVVNAIMDRAKAGSEP
ncbi:MAG: P-loop NTPase [Deltaproteobacteria bacterium]|nr:P-loop NTPase [Deltaproteobacteria bacterium]